MLENSEIAATIRVGRNSLYDVHSDHLDTPRMLTDSTGLPSWRASYEAFGRAHVSSDPDGSVPTPNPDLDFNIRFPGQYFDAESGLHYNRFRYYAPELGRYLSADPLGQYSHLLRYGVSASRDVPVVPGGTSDGADRDIISDLHPYTYAFNQPLSVIDPTGEFGAAGCAAGGAAGAAIGALAGAVGSAADILAAAASGCQTAVKNAAQGAVTNIAAGAAGGAVAGCIIGGTAGAGTAQAGAAAVATQSAVTNALAGAAVAGTIRGASR